MSNKPLIDKAGNIREVSAEEMAQFKPVHEVMSPEFVQMVMAHEAKRTRGRQKAPVKELVSIRLSPDVLAAFRATGKGWQARMDKALAEWLEQQA
ncbi:BrnA antitoxin family protein [Neisseria animalis]|uniref:BrnA antitoxin family protein n=1 Tax=Neisseria animalis TaxID=492 RepID=A0A5P3MT38_NEIAN|nr:BrnA antitoxin family protein [Neisseria animalis]QEY24782.1 hypothetical protein D0T90_10150 [Neisseria animalis]ROW31817.1 hypothetical protein CGZ60_08015 [Neisseria animalis]VEE07721.1 Uncharacterized protein conserved in bacteria [Neisseria animalis]